MGRVFGEIEDEKLNFIDSTAGLIQMCKDWLKPDMVMAEIGCFRGVSTGIFAEHVKIVYAIDPWALDFSELPRDMMEKAEPGFDKVMEKYPNIIKIKKTSVEGALDFEDESLDLVYIDADHREAAIRADMAAWVPKVKHGGLVAGHDFCMTGTIIPASSVIVYPEQSWIYRKGFENDIKGAVR